MEMQQAFSLKEAAKLIGCHSETLRKVIKRGQLKAGKIGRDFRISRFDLETYWREKGGGKLFKE